MQQRLDHTSFDAVSTTATMAFLRVEGDEDNGNDNNINNNGNGDYEHDYTNYICDIRMVMTISVQMSMFEIAKG